MCLELDIFFEEIPRQKCQREFSKPCSDEEVLGRVDDLCFRDVDINDAKILLEAVPEEGTAEVQQQPEFLVRDLQRDDIVPRGARVEVAVDNAGIGSEVVDDGLGGADVVVDERGAWLESRKEGWGGAADDRDARQGVDGGANGFAVAVRVYLDFGLAHGDELGVDGDYGAGAGVLLCWIERLVCLRTQVGAAEC